MFLIKYMHSRRFHDNLWLHSGIIEYAMNTLMDGLVDYDIRRKKHDNNKSASDNNS